RWPPSTPVSAACRSRWWSLRSPRRSAVSPPRLRGATASTSLATRSSWPTTSPASSRPSRSGPSITDEPRHLSRGTRALSPTPQRSNVPAWGKKGTESIVKGTDVPSTDDEQVRRYRVAKYRVALVREGSIPVAEKRARGPADVARLMTPLIADLDREAFWVLLLDGKNKIIGINLVALG